MLHQYRTRVRPDDIAIIDHLLHPPSKYTHSGRPDAFKYSPILKRLPVEILLEIFITCNFIDYAASSQPFVDPFYKNLPRLRGSKPPLNLCHINSEWRNLVLHTPHLWSRFALTGNLNVRFKTRKPEDIIFDTKVWIARSGNML